METDKKELLKNLTDEELEKEMARRNDIKRDVAKKDILAKQRIRHKAELISEGIIDVNTTEEDLFDKLYDMYKTSKFAKEENEIHIVKLTQATAILEKIPKRIILKAKRKMATHLII